MSNSGYVLVLLGLLKSSLSKQSFFVAV